jgi:hypothetical protein
MTSKVNEGQKKAKKKAMPSLSSHPIFQINKNQYKSFQKDTRRNVVTFKGTEVYVAVGSTVRCAELREWHAMEDERQGEKCYQVHRLLLILMLDTGISKCNVPN